MNWKRKKKRKKKKKNPIGSLLEEFENADIDVDDIMLDVIGLLREQKGRYALEKYNPEKVLYICLSLVATNKSKDKDYPEELKVAAIWTIRYYPNEEMARKILNTLFIVLSNKRGSILYSETVIASS